MENSEPTPADPITAAAQILCRASRVVCLTGAGVSAESGVPTFRDAQTGLWAQFDPEELASPAGFQRNPGLVWRWYMSRLALVEQAEPNPGHRALAQMEELFPHFVLITQNVDDLHERAGSQQVIHLHGRITRFRCSQCGAPYQLRPRDREAEMPPVCRLCNGWIRPDVVWFGEPLPQEALIRAWDEASQCHAMLVVGTSGVVYPAAQLPQVAREHGAAVIDVNPEKGPMASLADIFLQGPSGVVLPQLVKQIPACQEEHHRGENHEI